MQSWIRVVLLFFTVIILTPSADWGHSTDYRVYYLGEEANLSLSTKDGRVYGLKTELLKLAEEFFPETYPPRAADSQWLPLRTFWEGLGLNVNWLPEVKAIIVSENTGHIVVPQEAQEIMEKALADTQWLSVNSEQELHVHLSQFYTPELIEKIFLDTWSFLQLETDWHSLYQLADSQGIDAGEDWLLVKVTVSENISPDEELRLINGIIKLRKLDVGWRIDAHHYYE